MGRGEGLRGKGGLLFWKVAGICLTEGAFLRVDARGQRRHMLGVCAALVQPVVRQAAYRRRIVGGRVSGLGTRKGKGGTDGGSAA